MSTELREAWLMKAAQAYKDGLFNPNNFLCPLDKTKLGVGYPPGKKYKQESICLKNKDTKDGLPQIYISPRIDNTEKVLERLGIELVTAWTTVSGPSLEKLGFIRGNTTQEYWVAGEALKEELKLLALELGAYPHSSTSLKISPPKGNPLNTAKCIVCRSIVYFSNANKERMSGSPICPCSPGIRMAITKEADR